MHDRLLRTGTPEDRDLDEGLRFTTDGLTSGTSLVSGDLYPTCRAGMRMCEHNHRVNATYAPVLNPILASMKLRIDSDVP